MCKKVLSSQKCNKNISASHNDITLYNMRLDLNTGRNGMKPEWRFSVGNHRDFRVWVLTGDP